MARPCTCERWVKGEAFDVKRDCRLCWLYHNRADYRAYWDAPAATEGATEAARARAAARIAAATACTQRGEATGLTHPCMTCQGKVDVEEFACGVHSLCVIDKIVSGITTCRICPDRKAPEG